MTRKAAFEQWLRHAAVALPLFMGMVVGGCSHSPSGDLLREFGHRSESPDRFGVCLGYGCSYMHMTALTPVEWEMVRESYGPPPADAEAERAAIRRAIGKIERLVGPKTGTENDAPGAAILNLDRKGQMDCIDEAFNTTNYLRFLDRDGLLLWHVVGQPARRGAFIDGWPHNSATIREKDGDAAFAVDSWFHGNGVPPEIVSLDGWLGGWSPERSFTLMEWRAQKQNVAGSQ